MGGGGGYEGRAPASRPRKPRRPTSHARYQWIRENPDALDRALKKRGAEPESARLIGLDEARRAAIGKLEEAGPPQRRLEGNRQGEGAKDEAAAGR
jgi:seryl-tRNA synthetase